MFTNFTNLFNLLIKTRKLAFIIFIFVFSNSFAGSVGPSGGSSFSNVSQSGSSVSWVNVNNAQFEDGVYSTAVLPKNKKYSDYLYVTNLGFNIPLGSIINGVKVEIRRSASRK